MPTYDFQCGDCHVVHELIQSIHKPLPDALPCPRCGKESFHVFLIAPGVITSGMTHQSFDVAIGKDAETRWNHIHEKRAARDKVRRESGEHAVRRTGKDEYEPIKGAKLTPVVTPEPTND